MERKELYDDEGDDEGHQVPVSPVGSSDSDLFSQNR